jgi:hypothetical protein
MPKVIFHGRVLPASLSITIDHDVTTSWPSVEDNLDISLQLEIKESEIKVECEVSRWGLEYFAHVYKRAFDITRGTVSLLAFKEGYGLGIELHSYTDPDGIRIPLQMLDPRLPELCTVFADDESFTKLHHLVLKSWPLSHALADLIESITQPNVGPKNCGRAIETIRHLVAPDQPTAKQWDIMRERLFIDRAYLQLITENSKGPRHGEPGFISGAITNEITLRAWRIMNRYLEFLLAGESLPAETPILQ